MFERNNYTVLEFVSIVEVCIVVLGDFVNGGVVILSTEDGTATGETHTHTHTHYIMSVSPKAS